MPSSTDPSSPPSTPSSTSSPSLSHTHLHAGKKIMGKRQALKELFAFKYKKQPLSSALPIRKSLQTQVQSVISFIKGYQKDLAKDEEAATQLEDQEFSLLPNAYFNLCQTLRNSTFSSTRTSCMSSNLSPYFEPELINMQTRILP